MVVEGLSSTLDFPGSPCCLAQAWKQSGHGARSLQALMDLGRRLTNVAFITFAAFFEGFFPSVFVPFSLLVQRTAEPQELERAATQTMDKLHACKKGLAQIKKLVLVSTLLRQHCAPGEVVRLLDAFCYTKASRQVPGFLAAVMRIVFMLPPKLQNVALQTTAYEGDEQYHCLGPHCQCLQQNRRRLVLRRMARNPYPELGENQVYIRIYSQRGRRGQSRRIRVPLWTVSGAIEDHPERPRVQKHIRSGEVLLGANAMRPHITEAAGSRCQVPELVYAVSKDILAACDSASSSIDAFIGELEEMFKHVGVNDDMQEVRNLGGEAFDWNAVLHPNQVCLRSNGEAFKRFTAVLLPFLKNSRWPEGEVFAGVRPER